MARFFGVTVSLILLVWGAVLFYGAYCRWPVLVDPPEGMSLVNAQVLLKRLFGKRAALWDTYFLAVVFIGAGLFGMYACFR
ncbi:MAG: hypothetical protein ACREQX_08350 [Candidatus Binataceae bacterium]